MSLAIVDLGYGNLGSIRLAFERIGARPQVTADPAELAAAERIVLPGVGAAGFAMNQIARRGLFEVLRSVKQPALGICLGMQLLFERSAERERSDEDVACLGIVPGKVVPLAPSPGLPVPHMGWSRLSVRDSGLGVGTGDYVYFAHSYACSRGSSTVATATYGRTIPAVIRHGNWLGAQFHPERSGEAGARFLKAFLA